MTRRKPVPADPPHRPGPGRATRTAANRLADREPELAARLTAFRDRVTELLLDRLAAACPGAPALPAKGPPHPLEDLHAAAQVLRVLAKASWDASDLRLFDAFWRHASRSDLFADDFEPERHRIEHCVASARRELLTGERGLW